MKLVYLSVCTWLFAAATLGCGDDGSPASTGTTGGEGGTGAGGVGAGGVGAGGATGGEGGEGGAFHDPATGAWEEGFGLPGLSGFAARASAIVEGPDGKVYVGGIFAEAAGTAASNVAAWNGDDWEALGDGLPGWVKALTFGADGALYAGGSFATDTTANRLARWDGATWTMLPGDVVGDIDALASQGDRILVGGAFADVDGVATAGIAAWDDVGGWSAIGTSGTDWDARSILVTGDDSFCIGGSFSEVDGVPAANVACWDGGAWSQLGDGLPGMVEALGRSPGGSLFAGGSFAFVDGSTGEYEAGIAELTGSTWQAFEGGVDNGFINDVRAVAFAADGDILIGGTFETVQKLAVPALNIARYDFEGAGWSEVGGGLRNDVGVALGSIVGVNDILVRGDGQIVAGGLFSSGDDGQVQAANLAALDGDTWSAVVSDTFEARGVGGLLNAIDVDAEGRVIGGGYFTAAGSVAASNIARLGRTGWEPLGDGLSDVVRAVHVATSGDLYAGGDFGGSGTTPMPFFAKWNGTAWSAVGPALDGPVSTIVEGPGGELYVGGDFGTAGTVKASRVARWDGTAWSAVGAGFDGRVTSLALDASGRLVATGLFRKTGATTVNGLAIFEDGAWKGFGGGFDGSDTEYGSRVVTAGEGFYVAGNFTAVDGTPVTSVARWDGESFSAVGELDDDFGFGIVVSDIVPYGDGLFATGTFTKSGGASLSYIGWWDGTAWRPLASGLGDIAESIHVHEATLWVGGGFVEVDGRPASGLAAWAFAD